MPICKKCGLILAASDKVCRGCGTPVAPTAQPSQDAQPPQFPSSAMPESTPLPKPSGLTYSSPLSSSAPQPSAPPPIPAAPPPTPSFAAPPPIPSTPQSPAAPPPTPSFAAPPPLSQTSVFGTTSTSGTYKAPTAPMAPPPVTPPPVAPANPAPPASQPAAPQPPTPPPEPVAAAQPQPPKQQPAEQPQEPKPIRPKAFKPNGGASKLPPNLDIDNQPVSGVRKPFQQPQQPPMAQPINMAQIPPMANPPIKEQPIYQPFTPPTQQPPNSNGSFSTGMVWAILVLILCCNPIAIASIVLSAIAGAEFKRGDFENAQKHASLSKKITIAAAIITIIFGAIINNLADETTSGGDQDLQEEVENDPAKERMVDEAVEKIQDRIKQNQSNNGVKINIQPRSPNGGKTVDEDLKKAILKELEKQQRSKQKSQD